MTLHYPDLSCASDWLKQTSVMKRPMRSTSLFWVVLHYLYRISALVPQTTFRGGGGKEGGWVFGETSDGVAKCGYSLAYYITKQ